MVTSKGKNTTKKFCHISQDSQLTVGTKHGQQKQIASNCQNLGPMQKGSVSSTEWLATGTQLLNELVFSLSCIVKCNVNML